MLESSLPDDPWETPPAHLDPELVETSQRLMAKSDPASNSASEVSPPIPEDEKDQKIQQLEQDKQWLFRRNVNLVAEVAQLRAANQQLLDQIAQLKRPPQPGPGLLGRWLRFFR